MANRIYHGADMYVEFANYQVTRTGREFIGDAVAKLIKEVISKHPDAQVMGIVPRMMTYFGPAPERFEVTEVDVVVKYTKN